jgi:alginate O-acetyltransferase complex protein AlgI
VVFSSIIFLFLYLPVILGFYWIILLPRLFSKAKVPRLPSNMLLLAASIFFYAWGEKLIVLVMLLTTAIDYIAGLVLSGAWKRKGTEPLQEGAPRSRIQKATLAICITSNLTLLGFFKYFNFFADNFIAAAGALGLPVPGEIFRVVLPFGISFYTFQSMSYTIDVYRGKIAATRSFVDFACFVTMFPQLIAGPIVRYSEIAHQLVERFVSIEDFAAGVRRFVVGLGKKVMLANNLAVVADKIFALPAADLTTDLAWLGAVSFTLQIYFDFSGYSDMAIGIGRMLGFTFPENFNYPYISRSFREYWRRWHITLTTWFRDYLYFPLGGSRRSVPRTYFNLLVVFLLCGLWHGASWTFIAWGLGHGALMTLERLGLGKALERLPRLVGHLYFLVPTLALKVLFRSETFEQAASFLAAMAGFAAGDGSVHNLGIYLNGEVVLLLVIGLIGCTPVVPFLRRKVENVLTRRKGITGFGLEAVWSVAQLATFAALFILSASWLASGTYKPFIYFRF